MDSFKSKLSRLANWVILLPKKILGWHKPEVAPAKEEKNPSREPEPFRFLWELAG